MSGSDRPEVRAFQELEGLVRNLGEELAAFRRRALLAEARLKELGVSPQPADKAVAGGERFAELDAENRQLRGRLTQVEERVRQMMDRVRFLRQQVQTQTAGTGRA